MLRYLQAAIVSTLLIHTTYHPGGMYGSDPITDVAVTIPSESPASIDECINAAPNVVSHLMKYRVEITFRCISRDASVITNEMRLENMKVTNEVPTIKEVE